MSNKKQSEKLGLYIPTDTHQTGSLTIEGSIRIDGSFSGQLYGESSIYISKTGFFSGEADVAQAEISGTFEGNLRARGLFYLSKSGHFSGILDTKTAKLEEGCCLEGEVRIQGHPR